MANQAILELLPPGAEQIYVGKRARRHAMEQAAINRLLWCKAREAAVVVRLKGGDPFVFGRGGEEMIYLRERGVEVAVVPGLSSALAAPALAGVPVTQRNMAAGFAVVTGHRVEGAEAPDWAALARLDTLVILMGLGNLALIAANLVAAGRSPETPAMAVQWSSLPQQRQVVGTLATLQTRVAEARLGTPATLVIGDVVALAAFGMADRAFLEAQPAWLARPVAPLDYASEAASSCLTSFSAAEFMQ